MTDVLAACLDVLWLPTRAHRAVPYARTHTCCGCNTSELADGDSELSVYIYSVYMYTQCTVMYTKLSPTRDTWGHTWGHNGVHPKQEHEQERGGKRPSKRPTKYSSSIVPPSYPISSAPARRSLLLPTKPRRRSRSARQPSPMDVHAMPIEPVAFAKREWSATTAAVDRFLQDSSRRSCSFVNPSGDDIHVLAKTARQNSFMLTSSQEPNVGVVTRLTRLPSAADTKHSSSGAPTTFNIEAGASPTGRLLQGDGRSAAYKQTGFYPTSRPSPAS